MLYQTVLGYEELCSRASCDFYFNLSVKEEGKKKAFQNCFVNASLGFEIMINYFLSVLGLQKSSQAYRRDEICVLGNNMFRAGQRSWCIGEWVLERVGSLFFFFSHFEIHFLIIKKPRVE